MTFNPLQSLTGYASESLITWRNETLSEAQSSDQSGIWICIAAEAGHAVLALAGLVETVFRSFLFMGAAAICFCLPEEQAATWKADYAAPACEGMLLTTIYSLNNVVALVDNFSQEELKTEELLKKWFKPIESYAKPVLESLHDNKWTS